MGAREDLDRAVQADPRHARAWLNRGILRERSGDVEGAASDYGSAAAADPALWEPWYARGCLRQKQGREADAAHDFAKYVERARPGDPNVAGVKAWLEARR